MTSLAFLFALSSATKFEQNPAIEDEPQHTRPGRVELCRRFRPVALDVRVPDVFFEVRMGLGRGSALGLDRLSGVLRSWNICVLFPWARFTFRAE